MADKGKTAASDLFDNIVNGIKELPRKNARDRKKYC